MSWFADFFFGKSVETLKAMKADRENQIQRLNKEIAEIDNLIASQE